jgi:hypothetical protein
MFLRPLFPWIRRHFIPPLLTSSLFPPSSLFQSNSKLPSCLPVTRRRQRWRPSVQLCLLELAESSSAWSSTVILQQKGFCPSLIRPVHSDYYCHVFSDCRRGIGMTTGFIGSTLTTRGYTLQFPVTHTH